jgi:putative copper export protein
MSSIAPPTDAEPQGEPLETRPIQQPSRRFPPRWRKMTWALIIWSGLMLAWVIGGTTANKCASYADAASKSGCQAGTAIGVGLIIGLWFMGFVVLALIWFMTRPKSR